MPPSDQVTVDRPADAAAFLAEAGPFLAAHEAEHNLPLGLAASLVIDPTRYAATPYFAVLRSGAEVVGAALMTPPFGIVLSLMEHPDAARALVDDLAAWGGPVGGATGAIDLVRDFGDRWTAGREVIALLTRSERIYRADRVTMPSGVGGHGRVATAADRDILVASVDAFLREALAREGHDEATTLVDRALATGTRTFYAWDDGGVVSIAAVGGPTPNGIRLGPVYTPPEQRGRGYGSAVTAFATQAQFDAGRRFVFLFTDLANPTSNKIYQAIGYAPVIDVEEWRFEPTG